MDHPDGEAGGGHRRRRQARDAELVRAVRDGDAAAFGRLHDVWFDAVFDVAARLVRKRADAVDVAVETFEVAWRRLPGLEPPEALAPWLLRLARNAALVRHHGARPGMPEPRPGGSGEAGPDDAAAGLAGAATVADAIALPGIECLVWEAGTAISARDLSLLDLHLRHDLAPGEAASALGLNPAAAERQIVQLRERFGAAVRTIVLWNAGEPDCDQLTAKLRRSRIETFDIHAVRLIERHAKGCAACTERRVLAVDPTELLAAVPLTEPSPDELARAGKALMKAGVPLQGSTRVELDASPSPAPVAADAGGRPGDRWRLGAVVAAATAGMTTRRNVTAPVTDESVTASAGRGFSFRDVSRKMVAEGVVVAERTAEVPVVAIDEGADGAGVEEQGPDAGAEAADDEVSFVAASDAGPDIEGSDSDGSPAPGLDDRDDPDIVADGVLVGETSDGGAGEAEDAEADPAVEADAGEPAQVDGALVAEAAGADPEDADAEPAGGDAELADAATTEQMGDEAGLVEVASAEAEGDAVADAEASEPEIDQPELAAEAGPAEPAPDEPGAPTPVGAGWASAPFGPDDEDEPAVPPPWGLPAPTAAATNVVPMPVGSPRAGATPGEEDFAPGPAAPAAPPPPSPPASARPTGRDDQYDDLGMADEFEISLSRALLPLILTGAAAVIVVVAVMATFLVLRPDESQVAVSDVAPESTTTTTEAVRSAVESADPTDEAAEPTVLGSTTVPAGPQPSTTAGANGPVTTATPGGVAPSEEARPRRTTTVPRSPTTPAPPQIGPFPTIARFELPDDTIVVGRAAFSMPWLRWQVNAESTVGYRVELRYPPMGSSIDLAFGSGQMRLPCPVPPDVFSLCSPPEGRYGYDLVVTRTSDGEQRSASVTLRVVGLLPTTTEP